MNKADARAEPLVPGRGKCKGDWLASPDDRKSTCYTLGLSRLGGCFGPARD
jgi:hypothetical protein